MHLGNDSKIRPYYEKAPIYLDFRIYLFNVTNKEEVIEGGEYYLLLEIVGFFFFFLKQISLFFFYRKTRIGRDWTVFLRVRDLKLFCRVT